MNMKIAILDKKGNKIEDLELETAVFGQKENPDLLSQYVYIYQNNQRQGTRSIKTRAEVSGGGKKPWKQKGTGRARHGSIRSPIWVHGGIAHGPKPKEFSLDLPKKMKKKAMQCALSYILKEGHMKVIDELKLAKPRTKEMAEMFENLKLAGKLLVVLNKRDENVQKSLANLAGVHVSLQGNLNVFELLDARGILLEKEAVLSLQKKYK